MLTIMLALSVSNSNLRKMNAHVNTRSVQNMAAITSPSPGIPSTARVNEAAAPIVDPSADGRDGVRDDSRTGGEGEAERFGDWPDEAKSSNHGGTRARSMTWGAGSPCPYIVSASVVHQEC